MSVTSNFVPSACPGYCFFLALALLLRASSFSPTFMLRCSASARRGFQFLLLTVLVSSSHWAGIFSTALLNIFSASSSVATSSRASSGQNSTHWGSPLQRSHAVARPVSGWMAMPPYSQAWTHQSQPLHFLSLIMMMPVPSAWLSAFSGQAVTHLASSQLLHAKAKLKRGFMRTTRILESSGLDSPFSWLQAYSQIPQPVHLDGSTETNFLLVNLAGDIAVMRQVWAI